MSHPRIHLTTFLFLLPFFSMLAMHRILGLSDNFLAAPSAGQDDAAAFNLIMVLTFWAGTIAFFIHMAANARLGNGWVLAKFGFLLALFGVLIWAANTQGP